ncbi:Multicopper oxidase [uncultured Gammaproteobacteria bacterium]|jgi:bilirubin oxidase|uniref:multicopper oxidase family protein n=1 Tax=thiotrophic endosymbiont of Bathymodiolus puteoserpentis (Logatchev) TaxID=343240 RepID=UPI0010B516FB|nr:multicopper oxidase domain-containing protein [thiotrophic endosymbiont of Bathymodiolus puteoserpentis (Logatchev)]CAC9495384.1 Multicopper oxidase [uncultured Gammaproteobacteria bacterium]CAC9498192.1 Multicopper oxidase [uncultured Gammaproteobacteria bacterium]CAC9571117.1 Multicopper oxidase [uncultured Gammaproteobacteria bacterium]CAC9573986.1 Multicopper oxidase [uncultured Gammaproteobacteria bacterium]CAC9631646.1 Multicopper oxidase [uncultured Gammaproteobacteria bacterium]
MISRRSFIQAGLVLAALPKQIVWASGKVFRNTFRVPKLELGRRVGKDVYFDLSIQSGRSAIFPNKATPTLGINQDFLGVTLRANKGDRVHISVKNTIDKTTTLHWHGMKLPAKADGGPHQPIAPNQIWQTQFDIIQDAATLWYHSHQLHKTAEQVYQGLAGLFIIGDDASKKLNLPSEYGVDDLPVIIQDKDFNRNGSFSYLGSMMDSMRGMKGNTVLVNGVVSPVLKAKKSLLRLRLLNGSNARTYHLSFNDNRVFTIIGSDGGLLEHSIKANTLRLAPAERVEILVDVSDGGRPILQHAAAQESSSMGGMGMMGGMMNNERQDMDIFQIDASDTLKSTGSIPKNLVKHNNPQQSAVSKQRRLVLQMQMGPRMMLGGNAFSINGKTMDVNRIDEVVKAGSTEIWHLENTSMMPHPLHIHNVQFKVIARRGGVKGHELGFKDVVLVHPRERVSVIMKFPEFRDAKIPYMYHCHILEHEDRGMMGQFVVV